MNKLYHYGVLAVLATPFNVVAVLCINISYWISSIGKNTKNRYTYANFIKYAFNIKEEIDSELGKKIMGLCLKKCEAKIAEEKIKWEKAGLDKLG